MERWVGKVAVITGASAGIGAAILRELLKSRLRVVGLARRPERIEEVRARFTEEQQDRLFTRKCDVSSESNVNEAFDWVQKELGGTDILVNCAGVLRTGNIVDLNSTTAARETMETNVMGMMYCTRAAFQQMKTRRVDGHVVALNSLAGHFIPEMFVDVPMINMYFASKHAVTAMVESFRQEFLREQTQVKITSISPGPVDTDIFPGDFRRALPGLPCLSTDDVASAVLYALGTPPTVQIKEIMLEVITNPRNCCAMQTS